MGRRHTRTPSTRAGAVAATGERLLAAELVEESHTVQPQARRAGLGWMRSAKGDPPRVQHSGAGTAFNAQVTFDPGAGVGVVVLLNSFTPSREHAYEVADGILAVVGGDEPEVGSPFAVRLDAALAALTLLALLLGVLGVRRVRTWAARRREWRGWRFGLRLLPQLLLPALAVFLFLVAPALQDNSFTPVAVFWIYPALTSLLLVAALVGLAVTGARGWQRWRAGPLAQLQVGVQAGADQRGDDQP